MDIKKMINPSRKIDPSVYAYIIPQYPPKDGWVKIGYTTREPQKRIAEQSKTIGVATKTLWHHFARFNSGQYFDDHDFHTYLEKHKIERQPRTEWFNFGPGKEGKSENLFMKFTFKKYDDIQKGMNSSYTLRVEQEEAVQKALNYAKNNPEGEFLWNAKPRFGKTLSAYDFARKLDAKSVLIVTNRPAIANSWFDDFEKFIAWQTDYKFVSDSDSLKNREPLSTEEFVNYSKDNLDTARRLEFISLQDLKGSKYHGGEYDKLKWVSKLNWDLLIIDEAHEGVDTLKTDIAFTQIKRKFTLHLSGTPFKAIAKGNFSEEQIFNWSYTDEQEAKYNWDKIERNPYEELPKLNMFTYQMSNMIIEEINKGAKIDGKDYDYAFDLNEFFSTNDSGKFIYEKDIINWLDSLSTNEKYPFSTDELRNNLRHTFWILNRVDSTKALARILRKHPVFKEYEIVVAAGDGEINDMIANEKSLDRVKKAIRENDKTITLSVGQLTTGVTIPEWSAVMMLSNIKSPALYMQAAFRAQNPHKWEENINGKKVLFQKENSYVFDFSPERTLIIFDNLANDLNSMTANGGGASDERKDNIKKLLNFFPVIGEDLDGVMKELDFTDVLTIPKQIKATEVVKRGFMSNLLFANISRVFAAPKVVLDTLNNLKKEEQGRIFEPKEDVDTRDIEIDDKGQSEIDDKIVINNTDAILGNKIYGIEKTLNEVINSDSEDLVKETVKDIISSDEMKDIFKESKEVIGATNRDIDSTKRSLKKNLEKEIEISLKQKEIDEANIKSDYKEKSKEIVNQEEKKQLEEDFSKSMDDILNNFKEKVKEKTSKVIEDTAKEFAEKKERKKANKEKNQVEDDIRSRLRGFARTIPSFIMAYGEKNLTLANFDSYIPDDVFKEVTGITIEQFKFLRDGGKYEEDGEIKVFEGGLFDEMVFDQSIQEFLNKKEQLDNYFEDHDEDIFDYIPPQETNQIYTPKNVVKMMVEELEKENPGIYDDSSKTFIDIYMKSGLYITEIVKKLYNSPIIMKEFPNDKDRIKHILENQVHGFAPSEIIYNIATRFIFGNFGDEISRKNFYQVDTTPYAKEGNLQELIDEKFGK